MVDDIGIIGVGHEACSYALYAVFACLSCAYHCRPRRLHCYYLDMAVVPFECLPDATDGASCAHSCYEDVDSTLGVVPYLFACGALVDGGVGRVNKLSENDGAGGAIPQLFGTAYSTRHAFSSGREDYLSSEGTKQLPTLLTHRLRHGQNDTIAFAHAYPCQPYARIT